MKLFPCLIIFCALLATPLRAQDSSAISGGSKGETAAASPAQTDLAALESAYAEDRAAVLRRLLARYTDELTALEGSLTAAGDQAGAARVRLEREQVLPSLGLPAVAEENPDEFSAFEDGPRTADPVAPLILPKDLNSILRSLQPGGPSRPTAAAPEGDNGKLPVISGSGTSNRSYRKVLRMNNAQLTGKSESLYPWTYWMTGNSASWSLGELPPGSYQILLRYACDEKNGGTLTVSFGEGRIDTKLDPTGNWKRRREVVIGPFEVKAPRADLLLKATSVNPNGYSLMDLHSVLVQSAEASGKP